MCGVHRQRASSLIVAVVLMASSIVSICTAEPCFYLDFDDDADPWTIRTSVSTSSAQVSFILKVPTGSPADCWFWWDVDDSCCEYYDHEHQVPATWPGVHFDVWGIVFDPTFVDDYWPNLPIGFGCEGWGIILHVSEDAPLVPGERHFIGYGDVRANCLEPPPFGEGCVDVPHQFKFYFHEEGSTPCEDSVSEVMSLECEGASLPEPIDVGAPRFQLMTNPVGEELTYAIHLTQSTSVQVRIHDVTGRVMADLLDGPIPTGTHVYRWNAATRSAGRLPSGVYFAILRAGGIHRTLPFVLTQ